jgi:hypothetical protein
MLFMELYDGKRLRKIDHVNYHYIISFSYIHIHFLTSNFMFLLNMQTIALQYRKLLAYTAITCPLNIVDCSFFFVSTDSDED